MKGAIMKHTKTIEYILGIITGASVMLVIMMFIYNSLSAGANNVLEVKIINKAWEPITVQMKNN